MTKWAELAQYAPAMPFPNLNDITDRIAEPPLWWMQGVPRYRKFEPYHIGGIGFIVLLVRTECLSCRKAFDVVIATSEHVGPHLLVEGTSKHIDAAPGEPPYHLSKDGTSCGGCLVGADWTSVLQAWEPTSSLDWRRRRDLEGPFDDYAWTRAPI